MATLGAWEKSKVHQTAKKVSELETAAESGLHYGATANDLANFPGMMNLVAGSGVSLTPGTGTLTIAASGGGSVPTGTGFTHITAGVQDAAAKTVDLASSDVTGDLPYANLVQATAASRILVRGSAGGAGDWQEGTLGTNLSFAGTVLNASGGQVDTIVAGDGVDVDATDPVNPEVSAKISADAQNQVAYGSDGGLYVPLFGTSASMIGGTGEDGDCDLDGTNTFGWCSKSGNVYTLTRTPFINRLRLSTGCTLNTNCRPLFIRQWDATSGYYGVIQAPGNNGNSTTNQGGGAGGAAPTNSGSYYPSSNGTNGTTGTAGVFSGNSGASAGNANIGSSIGGQGGRGGQGGAGTVGTPGTPGTHGTFANFVLGGVSPFSPITGMYGLTASSTPGGQGIGGTGGTGDGAVTAAGAGGGGGGGGGIDLNVGEVVTDATTPAYLVRVRGGNGGNGANQGNSPSGNTGGGGGGGAGGGGAIRAVVGKLTGTPVADFFDASGGTGGNGGTGTGSGNPGNGGVGGGGGQVRVYNLAAGTVTVTIGSAGSAASGSTGGAGGACLAALA